MSISADHTRPVCLKPGHRVALLVVGGLALLGGGKLSAQVLVDQAVARFDAVVRDYNVVTIGNTTLTNTHTDGGVAVGGNLSLNQSVLAMNGSATSTSNPAVYVAGQLQLSGNSQLNNGYVSTPNLSSSTAWTYSPANNVYQRSLASSSGSLSYNTNHASAYVDPRSIAAPADWNWSAVQNDLIAASTALASASATGSISVSGQNLVFTPISSTAAGVVVFNLDASLFHNGFYDANADHVYTDAERVSNIQINIASDQYYVVNVFNATYGEGEATQLLFDGVNNFNSGSNNDQLLWNIIPDSDASTADRLTLGTNLYGSVLAPLVDIDNNGSRYVNGQIAAASFTQTGAEVHYVGFDSPVVFSPVPEPGTWGLGAVLVVGAAIAFHHRRSRRANER